MTNCIKDFTTEELEEELRVRKTREINGYLSRLHQVVAELEEHARKNALMVNLDFGGNGILLTFDPHMNEWEVW